MAKPGLIAARIDIALEELKTLAARVAVKTGVLLPDIPAKMRDPLELRAVQLEGLLAWLHSLEPYIPENIKIAGELAKLTKVELAAELVKLGQTDVDETLRKNDLIDLLIEALKYRVEGEPPHPVALPPLPDLGGMPEDEVQAVQWLTGMFNTGELLNILAHAGITPHNRSISEEDLAVLIMAARAAPLMEQPKEVGLDGNSNPADGSATG